MRASNQRLELIMKEHQETTDNLKVLLEAEVDELRCRLRRAEEKNLLFMQRSLTQMLPDNRSRTSSMGNGGGCRRVVCTGRCSNPKYDNATQIKEECECAVEGTTTEGKAYDEEYEVFVNRCGEIEGTRTRGTTQPTMPTRLRRSTRQLTSRRKPARNYPREVICLFFSVIILGLSYFVRSLDSGCRYQTLPYSPALSTGN